MRARALDMALEATVPIALIVLWWFWSASAHSFYYPPLKEILVSFKDTWLFSHVGSDLLPSLYRAGAGYAIGVILGGAIGALMGFSLLAWRALTPIVEFIRPIPGTALIPIGIIILGIGNGMKISVIALACSFPVLLNAIDGVRGVDQTYIDSGRVYGLNGWQRLRHVVIPAALPQIVAGMRTSLSLALVVMVVSEMLASYNGIGYVVLKAEGTYSLPEMWAGIILLGIIGYVLNILFSVVERRVLRWHHGSHGVKI
jgi:ABC-type nitrate/sulfonate/bicarbonate transport system permease component